MMYFQCGHHPEHHQETSDILVLITYIITCM